jgi:hypothetical protein
MRAGPSHACILAALCPHLDTVDDDPPSACFPPDTFSGPPQTCHPAPGVLESRRRLPTPHLGGVAAACPSVVARLYDPPPRALDQAGPRACPGRAPPLQGTPECSSALTHPELASSGVSEQASRVSVRRHGHPTLAVCLGRLSAARPQGPACKNLGVHVRRIARVVVALGRGTLLSPSQAGTTAVCAAGRPARARDALAPELSRCPACLRQALIADICRRVAQMRASTLPLLPHPRGITGFGGDPPPVLWFPATYTSLYKLE